MPDMEMWEKMSTYSDILSTFRIKPQFMKMHIWAFGVCGFAVKVEGFLQANNDEKN